jgi:hypothetical protein
MLTKGWKIDTVRLDRTVTAFTKLTEHVGKHPNRDEQLLMAPKAWTLISQLTDTGLADIALVHAQALVKARLTSKMSPEIKAASKDVLIKLGRMGLDDYITDTE